MANDVEHLFMRLFAICMSSLVKCLFMCFAYFLIEFFVFFYMLSFESSLCILATSPWRDEWFADIFQPVIFLFNLFTGGAEQRFLGLARSNLALFPYVDYHFGVKSKNSV